MATVLWVAGGEGAVAGQSIARSTDAVVWSAVADAFGSHGFVNNVAYGNATFVAVGTNQTAGAGRRLIEQSTDGGVTWTAVNTGTAFEGLFSQAYAVAYGNGLWIAAARQGAGYVTSPDLITWTFRTLPWRNGFPYTVPQTTGFLWTGTQWVAVADVVSYSFGGLAGQSVATSPDGITWTVRPTPFDGAAGGPTVGARCILQSGPTLIVGGVDRGLHTGLIMSSTDAATWIQHTTPWDTDGTILTLADHNGLLVAGGSSGDFNHLILTAATLSAWTEQSTPWDSNGGAFPYIQMVVSDGAQIVAVGDSTTSVAATRTVLSSATGVTWSQQTSPFDGNFGFGAGLAIIPPPPRVRTARASSARLHKDRS